MTPTKDELDRYLADIAYSVTDLSAPRSKTYGEDAIVTELPSMIDGTMGDLAEMCMQIGARWDFEQLDAEASGAVEAPIMRAFMRGLVRVRITVEVVVAKRGYESLVGLKWTGESQVYPEARDPGATSKLIDEMVAAMVQTLRKAARDGGWPVSVRWEAAWARAEAQARRELERDRDPGAGLATIGEKINARADAWREATREARAAMAERAAVERKAREASYQDAAARRDLERRLESLREAEARQRDLANSRFQRMQALERELAEERAKPRVLPGAGSALAAPKRRIDLERA